MFPFAIVTLHIRFPLRKNYIMAINLLIDTCILLRLVSKTEFSTFLREVEYLVKEEHVTLLIPAPLVGEWKKHKDEQKQKIAAALRSMELEIKQKRLMKDDSVDYSEEQYEEAKEHLYSQIDLIDELLYHYGQKISTTDELVIQLYKHRAANKHPFTNPKKDNYNDAEIIFSSLDYIKKLNQDNLYFVSDNPGDFAKQIENEFVLHPDIDDVFPTINTYYFTEIKGAFRAFEKLGIPRFNEKAEKKRNTIRNTIKINKNQVILNQLEEYIDKRAAQLIIIPKEIIIEHYPIVVSNTFRYLHRPFTLVTDNKDIFKLLSEVQVNDDVVLDPTGLFIKNKDDEDKIRSICRYLRFNYIEHVAFENGDPVLINYSHKAKECDCPTCSYRRLDFGKLLETLNSSVIDTTKEARLKQAFGQYKLGNFTEAVSILKVLYNEIEDKQTIFYYIVCNNLSNLSHLISHYYWRDKVGKELSDEFKDLDLEIIYKECRKVTQNGPLLEWIHLKKYYEDTLIDIHSILHEINDNFYSQNSGYNENTKSLLEYYYRTERFLNTNSIVFDIYNQFSVLTKLFTQGVFSSYGCDEFMGGKLTYFSDTALQHLLLYADADDIRKYFYRYKLKQVKHIPDVEGQSQFVSLVNKLWSEYSIVPVNYKKYIKSPNDYFSDKYNDIVYTSLALLAITDISEKEFNTTANNLLVFLNTGNHASQFQLSKNLKFFINHKRKVLSDDNLRSLFLLGIKNETLHKNAYIDTVETVLKERNIKLTLSVEEFEFVKNGFFKDSNENLEDSFYSLGYIHEVLVDEDQKRMIKEYMEAKLRESFSSSKYYIATMFDILAPLQDMTSQYTSQILEIILKGEQERFFDKRDYYHDPRVDNYLNFCFKYKIEIPGSITNHIHLIGPYYSWLINMDHFDYSQFNINWLDNHFTLYFKYEYRKSKSLKNYLLILFRNEINSEKERLFITTYCYED